MVEVEKFWKLGLLCAAAAVSQPLRASIPPALSAISSQDFVRLDLDGDGKLSRNELRRVPGLLLRLDEGPDPNDAIPAPTSGPRAAHQRGA